MLRTLTAYLRTPVNRQLVQAHAEIQEEIQFHLASKVEDLQGLGASSHDAANTALEQFGDVRTVLRQCCDESSAGQILLYRSHILLTVLLLLATTTLGLRMWSAFAMDYATETSVAQRIGKQSTYDGDIAGIVVDELGKALPNANAMVAGAIKAVDDKGILLAPMTTRGGSPEVPSNAPSLVMLPPRIIGSQSEDVAIPAQLACDRIAQEIQLQAQAQLVDRQQLDNVLNERQIHGASPSAMTSFDGIVRITVDNSKVQPTTHVALIDLNTGNEVTASDFGWPLLESDVPQLNALMTKAMSALPSFRKQRTLIRLLGMQVPEEVRLRSTAKKAEARLISSLKKLPNLMFTQHIEAATTAEESLFLMMGLSRLPGDRVFGPAADASLEFAIAEIEAAGKPFDETPLRIEFRLQTHSAEDSQWVVERGVVADLERMTEDLDKQLRKRLSDPRLRQRSAQPLSPNSLRRRQAESEIDVIRLGDGPDDRKQQARWRRRHALIARKLDPTYPDAVYELIRANSDCVSTDCVSTDARTHDVPTLVRETVALAANNIEELTKTDHVIALLPGMIQTMMFHTGVHINRNSKPKGRIGHIWASPDVLNELIVIFQKSIASKSAATIPYVKVQPGFRPIGGQRGHSSTASCDLMKFAFIQLHRQQLESPDRLKQRLEAIVKDVRRLEVQVADWQAAVSPNEMYVRVPPIKVQRIRFAVMAVAFELHHEDVVDQLLPATQQMIIERRDTPSATWLLHGIQQLGNQQRSDRFRKWAKPLLPTTVVKLIKPEALPVDPLPSLPAKVGEQLLNVVPTNERRPVIPIGLSENRLCVVNGDTHFPSWPAPLRKQGILPRPNRHQPPKYSLLSLTDAGTPKATMTETAPIPLATSYYRSQAVIVNNFLLVSQSRQGVWILNLETNEWKFIGPDEGLPVESVTSMHPMPDGPIFMTGNAWFTMNPDGTDIRQYADRAAFGRRGSKLCGIWEQDGTWYGLGHEHEWTGLLSGKPEYGHCRLARMKRWRDDWNVPDGFVALNGRTYIIGKPGITELDDDFHKLRSWTNTASKQLRTGDASLHITPPRDSPVKGTRLRRWGNMLAVFNNATGDCTLFDPESDQWYGPLPLMPAHHCVTANTTLWLGGDRLAYVEQSTFQKAAAKQDRVYTTSEYAELFAKKLHESPPTQRAQWAFCQGRFTDAIDAATQGLAMPESEAECRYLLGMANDASGVDSPEQAAQWYGSLPDNADSSLLFSAGYRRCQLLHRTNQTQQATEEAKRLLQRFPKIYDTSVRKSLERLSASSGRSVRPPQ